MEELIWKLQMAPWLHYGNIGLGSCFPSSVSPPSLALARALALALAIDSISYGWPALGASLYDRPASTQAMALYIEPLRNLFLAQMLDGALFSFGWILPIKIHQNLTSGFRFYTLHGSNRWRKFQPSQRRLKYSLRSFRLHCWLSKRHYRRQ